MSKLKRIFAISAATALAVSGAMLGSSAANAADIQMGSSDIVGWEDGAESTAGYNYDQWHIGSVESPATSADESLTFSDCSVTLEAVPAGESANWTQVLKGYPIDARPTAETAAEVDALGDLLKTIELDVASGDATVQIPMFLWHGPDPTSGTAEFFTLRNDVPLGAGQFMLTDSTVLYDGGFGTQSLDTFLDIMKSNLNNTDAYRIEVLGIGFNGSEGTVVNSVSFAGDTYLFGTGCDTAGPTDPAAPTKPSEIQTAAI